MNQIPASLARRADQRALEIFQDQTRLGKRLSECLGEIYMIGLMAGVEATSAELELIAMVNERQAPSLDDEGCDYNWTGHPLLTRATRAEADLAAALAERDKAIKDRNSAIQRGVLAHGEKLDAFRRLAAALAREARLREIYSAALKLTNAISDDLSPRTVDNRLQELMVSVSRLDAALATSEPEDRA